jgi:hypothetical protein
MEAPEPVQPSSTKWRRIAMIAVLLAGALAIFQEPIFDGFYETDLGRSVAAQITKPKPRKPPASWKTNWDKASVDLDDIQSGGVPRDGIPPIYDPKFAELADVDWLASSEPVAVLVLAGKAKAYPLQILMFHEMANDSLAGKHVLMTFCPLCNSVIAFDRTVDGNTYEFGVSGLLRNSDLIMWDHQTESLWQQFTGEAIVGEHTGARLTMLPSTLVSFAEFANAYPKGQVLMPGKRGRYGANPYRGYDSNDSPFLFRGKPDKRLHPTARVIAIEHGKGIAFRHDVLAKAHVLHDMIGEKPIVLLHRPGANSAMDTHRISEGRDVGSAAVYDARVDGKLLSFGWKNEKFVDAETGSTWNIFGLATAGELAGKQLQPVLHFNHFWFSWAAFHPFTEIRPVSGPDNRFRK